MDVAQHQIFDQIDLVFEDEKIQKNFAGIPISEQIDLFRDRIYSIGTINILNVIHRGFFFQIYIPGFIISIIVEMSTCPFSTWWL